jgi:hypothetical protein
MIFENAGVAQLVEYKLPKLGVAGSNPVARSIQIYRDQNTDNRGTDAGRKIMNVLQSVAPAPC